MSIFTLMILSVLFFSVISLFLLPVFLLPATEIIKTALCMFIVTAAIEALSVAIALLAGIIFAGLGIYNSLLKKNKESTELNFYKSKELFIDAGLRITMFTSVLILFPLLLTPDLIRLVIRSTNSLLEAAGVKIFDANRLQPS
ncbi:MAG: hypothetical protein A3E88_07590 [Legionellales bacterium RIFCSPHIGHO2_12_FULL_35_11]|nr:MAG: hypothetical protein A3E88_07590 [Legionellales bacterium RIFCSPHIGHO2_12_FULL_35_11]